MTTSVTGAPTDGGTAGASIQREYERRSDKRSTRIRAAHPRLGGLILAMSQEPQSTIAFRNGAIGERRAAARVQDLAGPDVLFLLNRKLGRGRRDGDIDMLAIGPARVYVVDVKRYERAAVSIRRTGGVLRPAREQLMIDGRDKTSLLTSMHRQVDAVRAALVPDAIGREVVVTPIFCFVDGKLRLSRNQMISGVSLATPLGTAKLVSQPGSMTGDDRSRLWAHLAERLPAAL